MPGVYVVKVTDEKHLQATTLVLGSDLDAVVKTSREQVLVFAQDMKTGKGRPGARVLVAEGDEVVLDAKTGADGVLLKSWEKPRDVERGARATSSSTAPTSPARAWACPDTVAQGLSPRAYLYTDRPAYRPGQPVALRGVVREVEDGQYANAPKAVYRLEVTDSRGRQIVAQAGHALGVRHLPRAAPARRRRPRSGTYRVRLYQPGKSDFAGQFEVQAYQLEKIDLAFDLKKTVYFRGETVAADLVARYQYGEPAAGPAGRRPPARRPDRPRHDRRRRASSTSSSRPRGSPRSRRSGSSPSCRRTTSPPSPTSRSPSAPSRSTSSTTRDVYLDGESFQVQVDDPRRPGRADRPGRSRSRWSSGSPRRGRTTEREVARKALKTDPKTGQGAVALKADDEQGGATSSGSPGPTGSATRSSPTAR